MARLTGPDEPSRPVYTLVGGTWRSAAGLTATIYADADATTLANILTYPGGSTITGSQVTVDSSSRLPLIQYPDGVDVVYVNVAGGPVQPIYADLGGRATVAGTIAAEGKFLAGARYRPGTKPAVPASGAACLLGSHTSLAAQADQAASLTYREGQLARPLALSHHFYNWNTTTWPGTLETADVAAGRIPLISLHLTTLSTINGGTADTYLTGRAQAMAAFGWPIMFRPGWEMNGNWFDWSGPSNGDDPALYIQAWQRIWKIWQQNHATNVAFLWCPNASSSPGGTTTSHANNWRNYYPGDMYVDWVGADAYNWGDYAPAGASWQNMRSVASPIIDDWKADFGGRGGSTKPFVVSEWGCYNTPGNKAHWVSDAAGYFRMSGVHAIVGFDTDNSPTAIPWKFDSDAATLAAYTEAAADPYFGGWGVGGGAYRARVLADSPFGYWKLDNTTSTYPDLGSGNNAGTATTFAIRGVPALRPGLGAAVSFNGSSRVDLGTLGSLGSSLSSGFTIEFLIKVGATAASRPQACVVGTLNTGTTTGLAVYLDTARALSASAGSTTFWYRNEAGTSRALDITTNIYDGLWHHVMWVCDPTAVADTVYVDGAAVTPFSTSNAANTGASANFGFPLFIGARNNRASVDQQMVGAVDELAIYTTKLASGRATAHYAALTA